MPRTFVIMEAAACHDGDLSGKAIKLIDMAKKLGADACKFQFCSNPEKLAERRNAKEYLESYKLLKFPHPHAQLGALALHCQTVGIEFMCTVYLPEDVEIINPYVKKFKIASFEAADEELLDICKSYNKEIIISLGMGQGEDPRYWGSWARFLHCVSAYPTPYNEINLARLRDLHGLSDHTKHPWTGGLAVAAGAQIIEFHARLDDTNALNADYHVSRTPWEAHAYVKNIRTAEVMLGDGVTRVMPSEESMVRYKVGPRTRGEQGARTREPRPGL